ncbi:MULTISPECIES: LPS-assembly protein LptD [unclassified Sphingomonas]|uniref:LPS-assembly protein LptD n=1 Tax=unclassified Sphingomonas TaxID=196159 RepID=UPI00177C5747|nr:MULTISPECIES: LPS assembly protein LptD [unclassified Sphingomonas]MBD8551464.1 LPS-assembly protein LptD [Sphingomonas sp. CFBP 8764]
MAGCALSLALLASGLLPASARAQDLQARPAAPPLPETPTSSTPTDPDQVQFSASGLEYDTDADIVTATGEVRMFRQGDRLRADKVVWNRKTGKVLATGNIAVTNPQGDIAYGDSIELTDSLKDGVVDNMLVVLEQGGRLAAKQGTREADGTVELRSAAYTPCAVVNSAGCPKEPTWKITAVSVTYQPNRKRIYYAGARLHLFGLPSLPLPKFSNPVGGGSDSGLLSPNGGYSRVNGFEVSIPYYLKLAPNQGLVVTPHLYTSVLPMLQADYSALSTRGAFSLRAYATESRRSDDLTTANSADTSMAFRGYLDGMARYQLTPNWSVSGSLRLTTDRTFLRRYDISRDDRLRSTASLERIDDSSYFALTGWYVQTLRVNDSQGQQPIALPEIDYRKRFDDGLVGGRVQLQLNTLALTRTDGQDTQRAFASAQWDLRRLTNWGQEVTFTAFARADAYNTNNTDATSIVSYRGLEGFHKRAIGAAAVDVKWPFIGTFLGGTQRFTPRVQLVAAPSIANTRIPNEDSRAVDLDDTNLFALNRFAGYDRFEDSSRATYGGEWALDLPGIAFTTNIGQSYRLGTRPTILPDGTGLSDRFSDIVGRSELRFRDFVSVVHRYRLDKDSLAIRRNEVDATIGSRATYVLVGYLKLNRNIDAAIEDLRDREEIRVAGRVQFARFWSAFGSGVVDLTNKSEDPLSVSDGFSPIRHRVGVQYEDDCLRLGATWRRTYNDTGDARKGNSFLLTLAFTNLGR